MENMHLLVEKGFIEPPTEDKLDKFGSPRKTLSKVTASYLL
jgi:hypothetical protein